MQPFPQFPTASSSAVVSLGEILGALSYALDLTEGQPEGHCVRCCWIGMQIAEALNLAATERADLYFTLLLKDLGCSSNAARNRPSAARWAWATISSGKVTASAGTASRISPGAFCVPISSTLGNASHANAATNPCVPSAR